MLYIGMSQYVSENLSHELSHLWRFALRLTRSTSLAEDLVQKTAVRALERKHQFILGTQLRSWLFSIMHSVWKNDLRSAAIRQQSTFNLSDAENYASEICHSENLQLFDDVISNVNRLPEAQRTVMLLVCVEGYSYQETADIMDVAVGTVMSRLARARLKIGEAFLDKQHDEGSGEHIDRVSRKRYEN